MKKLMAMTLALLMVLSLAACGSSSSSSGGSSSSGDSGEFVPSKNITWTCTSSAGGGSDIFSRKIADIMKNEKRGSLNTLTVRGNKAEILAIFATVNTVFFEALPLSLEEIFISETEVVGYDIKKLILG